MTRDALTPEAPAVASDDAPERSCVLTRQTDERGALVRLVLGPDDRVWPDVRAKAPGRGAWIGVDRAALDTAHAKGKLKGALSRAFKTGDFAIPDDLSDRIEAELRTRRARPTGAGGASSGFLVTGGERIETAARGGQLRAAVPRQRRRAPMALASWHRRGASGPMPKAPISRGWHCRCRAPYCHWRLAAKMWYISA